MGEHIFIVKNALPQYWEDENCLYYGYLDPVEWEILFFKEFKILTVFEFTNEGNNRNDYETYFAEKLASLEREYPLISRLNDYYQDAFFLSEEITKLKKEIKQLDSRVLSNEAKKILNQIYTVCGIAQKHSFGIAFIAD